MSDYIRYDFLVDKAMRLLVKEALLKVKKEGFMGEHHFLISFLTGYEGVCISPKLQTKYPSEVTIVLQHQYEDLDISDDKFQVVLSFDGEREKITIPFASLVSFSDPSVRFGLKFNILSEEEIEQDIFSDIHNAIKSNKEEANSKKGKNTKKEDNNIDLKPSNNVVTLESFRKKDKKE